MSNNNDACFVDHELMVGEIRCSENVQIRQIHVIAVS